MKKIALQKMLLSSAGAISILGLMSPAAFADSNSGYNSGSNGSYGGSSYNSYQRCNHNNGDNNDKSDKYSKSNYGQDNQYKMGYTMSSWSPTSYSTTSPIRHLAW